jgi:hypothetical protein
MELEIALAGHIYVNYLSRGRLLRLHLRIVHMVSRHLEAESPSGPH